MTRLIFALLTLFFLSGPAMGENSDFQRCLLDAERRAELTPSANRVISSIKMRTWTCYSSDDMKFAGPLVKNTLQGTPREEKCPVCAKSSIRFYYHELAKGGRIGSYYFWCLACGKNDHFTGLPLSREYSYTDPFDTLTKTEFGELEKSDWFDHLDKLWNDGDLPQEFTKKR